MTFYFEINFYAKYLFVSKISISQFKQLAVPYLCYRAFIMVNAEKTKTLLEAANLHRRIFICFCFTFRRNKVYAFCKHAKGQN